MKVKLINVAEYELKDGKGVQMPFDTFVNLCGGISECSSDNLPKVRLFKTMGEFISLSKDELNEIDVEEKIRVLPNGQFLMFLKREFNKEKKDTNSTENATADTEENTTE